MKNKERVIYDFICGITDEQAEKLFKAIKSGAIEELPQPDRPASPSTNETARP